MVFQVLQTVAVFHNVSRGELAKKAQLRKAFPSLDEPAICRRILDRGEYIGLCLFVGKRETSLASECL